MVGLRPTFASVKNGWQNDSMYNVLDTLPETNSEFTPENGWLEDKLSFWDGLFSGANC